MLAGLPLAVAASILPLAPCADVIRFQVLGADGQPAAYVEVTLIGPDQVAHATSLTDETGFVTFDPSPVGDLVGLQVLVRSPEIVEQLKDFALVQQSGRLTVLPSRETWATETVVVRARTISRPHAPVTIEQLSVLLDPATRADPVLAATTSPFSTNPDGSAELELRGASALASRVFLGDVPVYEVSRGSQIQPTTRGFSIFNIGVVDSIEIYPSTPPAYLSGVSGGAVRVLQRASNPETRTVTVSTVAASVAAGIGAAGSNNAPVWLFGSYSDLSPSLAINPSLQRTLSEFRSASVGATGTVNFGTDGQLLIFSQLDQESGGYPVSLFGTDGRYSTERQRGYLILQAAMPVGRVAVSANLGLTKTTGEERYLAIEADRENNYLFWSFDMAGDAAQEAVVWRVGIDSEQVRQQSIGRAPEPFYALARPELAAPFRLRTEWDEISAYSYASWRATPIISGFVGARSTVTSTLAPETAWQSGITILTLDRIHRWNLSFGRFYSADIGPSATGTLDRTVSTQAAISYRFRKNNLELEASTYSSEAHNRGGTLVTAGTELTVSYDGFEDLELGLAVASVDQKQKLFGREVPGQSDFGYLARFKLRYQLGQRNFLSVSGFARNGAVYTPILRGEPDSAGLIMPVFGDQNGTRLTDYVTWDVTYTSALPAPGNPLLFLTAANVLDRDNPATVSYSSDFSTQSIRSYPARTLNLGLIYSF
ncbi:MAG: hypothetical protein ING71_00340 [Rhodocyclaceae bacterium]|nr:hypothetical protein [Rhodocyclaceae bacterium]